MAESRDDGQLPDVRIFWGKAGRAKQGEAAVPHPLICHMVDTAVVAESLYDVLVGPRCRRELDRAFQPLGDPRLWTMLLCGLHDIGKLSPAFQALRRDVAMSRLPERAATDVRWVDDHRPDRGRTDTPHGDLTEVQIHRLLTRWGADRDVAIVIGSALGGHHGFFADAAKIAQARDAVRHHGGPRWAGWVDGMVVELVRLLGIPEDSIRSWDLVRMTPVAAVVLAGLAVVSDWLASELADRWGYAGLDVSLESYVGLSRDRAQGLVHELRWQRWQLPAGTGFVDLFGAPFAARPVQGLVEAVSEAVVGPAIVVVEAPTGEGKTKAALQCAAMWVKRHGLTGFYLAMPTRATSNQAFGEAADVLGGALPVMLLHGTAAAFLVDAELRWARRATRVRALVPVEIGVDTPGGGQDAKARKWFTGRRGLLGSVGVGTVDRLLQAVVRSWSPMVPLLGLSGKVVIIDEVHSYDVRMSELLKRLVWWLGRLDVPVILLSATLPGGKRDDLVRHWRAGALRCRVSEVPSVTTGPAVPPRLAGGDGSESPVCYPRVTWADDTGYQWRGCPAADLNQGRVISLVRVGDDELVAEVLRLVADGQCVAVVHNLVRRAVATRDAVQVALEALPVASRPELIFMTGKLDPAERGRVERRLMELFGRDAQRPPGAVVVGTNVLESSLDLDFDVLVTDLAPIDSLIQRAGRLYRFRKITVPPVMMIAGVTDAPAGPVFPPWTTSVYRDWPLVRTWAAIRDRDQLRMPDEIPVLVNAIYGSPDAVIVPEQWHERVTKGRRSWEAAEEAERAKARTIYFPPPPRADLDPQFLRALTFDPKSSDQIRKSSGRQS